MIRIHRAAMAALLVAALAAPAAAGQGAVTQAEIQRLQDNVYLAERDVTSLRGRDASRATQLQSELDDLRDEVVYLKVKLRKEGSLGRNEYSDVQNRIDNVRNRAQGAPVSTASSNPAYTFPGREGSQSASNTGSTATSTSQSTSSTPPSARSTSVPRGMTEIPVGTEIDVRLSNALNSGTAKVEDRFEGTTLVDVSGDGRAVIPAGSVVRGVVTSVDPATRTNRTAKMTVSFDQITVNGRAYPLRGTVTQAIEGEGIRGEAGRAGVGAGVGAIIGGILGGFKGALAGILIGGGGTIAATEGKQVELPQGAVLRVRVDSPLQVQTPR